MRPRTALRVLAASVAALALLAPAAAQAAPSSTTLYTRDGQWRVDVNAWKRNLLVYSSIGTEVSVYHWEAQRNWWEPWKPPSYRWVARPAGSISITNRYAGILQSLAPASSVRHAVGRNTHYLEEKIWKVGFGVSMDASPGSGLPDPSTGLPSATSPVEVREVHGSVWVEVGGEFLTASVSAQ